MASVTPRRNRDGFVALRIMTADAPQATLPPTVTQQVLDEARANLLREVRNG